MSPRAPSGTTEARLARLRALTTPDPRELRAALSSHNGHVVALAARRIDEEAWTDWLDALADAFSPLVDDGARTDAGCVGKVAVVKALAAADRPAWQVYLQGCALRQKEPVWGGTADTAGELRARCLLALVHTRHPMALDHVADGLADELPKVRTAAALAAGDSGHPGAGPLVRLKLRLGEEDPEALGALLGSLLALDSSGGLEIAEHLLKDRRDVVRESAGLALGESRVDGALPLLLRWHAGARRPDERKVALTAVALLRHEEAIGALVTIASTGPAQDARHAVLALGIYSHDPQLAHRVVAAVGARREVEEALVEAGFALPAGQ